jgi:flagellar protein FlgJ
MDFKIDPRITMSPATLPKIDKKSRDLKSIRESSRAFESMMVMEMMKAMRKTIPNGGLFGKSTATETFTELLDMETSKAAANGKGLGIGEMIYNQMANLIEKKKTT